jgi:hypothetical protein
VQDVITLNSGIFYWDFTHLDPFLFTHGHNLITLNTNLKPKFLFYYRKFKIIAIVYTENIIIQREVYNILTMGETAPIKYDYYTYEVTSINKFEIQLTSIY